MKDSDKRFSIVGWINLNMDGEVWNRDGITLQDGIPLKINRAETMWLGEDDVEIVTDPDAGHILYMSLTAEGFKRVMEEMHETWERTSLEEK